MHPKPRPPFTLTLVRCPDPVPARVRVRRALKLLLRSFRLRCIRIEPAVPPTLLLLVPNRSIRAAQARPYAVRSPRNRRWEAWANGSWGKASDTSTARA
jgi:hypothetical protein